MKMMQRLAARVSQWVLVSLVGSLPTPVRVQQVQVLPPNPQLGYTVSVQITGESDEIGPFPTIAYEDKTYQVFPVAANQWRAFIPTSPLDSPGPRSVQLNGIGDPTVVELNLQERTFPIQSIRLSPAIAALEPTEMEMTVVNQFRFNATPTKHWQGLFQPPSQGPVTTVFGVRRYYNGVFAENYYHRGIDYAGPVGSAVMAPAAGRVALVGLESEGFHLHGNMVGLDHGQGVTSVFLHLSRIDVAEGDLVQVGQVLGGIGSTGIVTGPHLHWGLFVNGVSVDPIPWMHVEVK